MKSASSNESVSPLAPQRTSKRESDSPKSAGDKKPAKRASKSQNDNDDDVYPPQADSDSPVLKHRSQKGRRVLQDSDSEGDTEKSECSFIFGYWRRGVVCSFMASKWIGRYHYSN